MRLTLTLIFFYALSAFAEHAKTGDSVAERSADRDPLTTKVIECRKSVFSLGLTQRDDIDLYPGTDNYSFTLGTQVILPQGAYTVRLNRGPIYDPAQGSLDHSGNYSANHTVRVPSVSKALKVVRNVSMENQSGRLTLRPLSESDRDLPELPMDKVQTALNAVKDSDFKSTRDLLGALNMYFMQLKKEIQFSLQYLVKLASRPQPEFLEQRTKAIELLRGLGVACPKLKIEAQPDPLKTKLAPCVGLDLSVQFDVDPKTYKTRFDASGFAVRKASPSDWASELETEIRRVLQTECK